MSILWCGGEDIDFNNPNGVVPTTYYNGVPMRTVARCAVASNGVFLYGVPILASPAGADLYADSDIGSALS